MKVLCIRAEEQQSWASSSAERNPIGDSMQAKSAEEGHWKLPEELKLTREPSRPREEAGYVWGIVIAALI